MNRQVIYASKSSLLDALVNEKFREFVKTCGYLHVDFNLSSLDREKEPLLSEILHSETGKQKEIDETISISNILKNTDRFFRGSICIFDKVEDALLEEITQESGIFCFNSKDISDFFSRTKSQIKKPLPWPKFFEGISSDGRTFAVINDRFIFFNRNGILVEKANSKRIFEELIKAFLPNKLKVIFKIVFLVDLQVDNGTVFKQKQLLKLENIKSDLEKRIKAFNSYLKVEIYFEDYYYGRAKGSCPELHERWIYFDHHLIGGDLRDVLPEKGKDQKKAMRWIFEGWEDVGPNQDDLHCISGQSQASIFNFVEKKGVELGFNSRG